jgi:hypothetical protein
MPDAIDSFVRSQMQTEEPDPIDEFVQGQMKKGGGFKKGVADATKLISRAVSQGPMDPLVQAGMGHMVAGILQTGIAKPLAATLEFPSTIDRALGLNSGETGLTKAADFIRRFGEGVMTETEETALAVGLTPDEISAAYTLGEVVGFTIPVVGAMKTVATLGRVKDFHTLSTARHFLVDSTAGLIFGGVMQEGDVGERVKHALMESAMFGAGNLVMSGALAFAGIRNTRAYQNKAHEEVLEYWTRRARGENVEPPSHLIDFMARLASEEQFVAGSGAAQAIMARSANEAAFIEGIRVAGRAGATGGVMRSAGTSAGDVKLIAERMKQEIPEFAFLKFDVVGNPNGGFDLWFGAKGLNNQQKALAKKGEMFPGQKLQKDGVELEFVGPASRPDYMKAKSADGKVVEVKRSNVTETPFFQEVELRTPHGDALYKDFERFYFSNIEKVLKSRGQWTEAEFVQAVRDGRLVMDPGDVRPLRIDGAMTSNPWEASIKELEQTMKAAEAAGDKATFMRAAEQLDKTARLHQTAAQSGFTHVQPMDAPDLFTFDDAFMAWAKQRGFTAEKGLEEARSWFTTRMRQQLWDSVDPETKTLLAKLRTEYESLVAENPLSLESRASLKGFTLDELQGGKVALKDINSGLEITFKNAADADRFVNQVVRTEGRVAEGLIPDPGAMFPGPMKGFEFTSDFTGINVGIKSKEFELRIPYNYAQNNRDWLIRVEEMTGLPVFSQGFDPLDRSLSMSRNRIYPWAREVEKIWKGIDRDSKKKIVKVWRQMEETDMSFVEGLQFAKNAGLSNKEIQALGSSRKLFDVWYKMDSETPKGYINWYLSKIPEMDNFIHNVNLSKEARQELAGSAKWWAEMTRTGDLAKGEMDPEVIMHKYVRAMIWKQEVKPAWDNVAKLVGTSGPQGRTAPLLIRDLPAETQAKILAKAAPNVTADSPVLPAQVQDVLREYLTIVRGQPGEGMMNLRHMGAKLFEKMGVEADPRLMEEYFNITISSMYGAAMGARLNLISRNLSQNLFMMYPRVGGRHMQLGLRKALTQEGWSEVAGNGTLRLTEAGLPYGDAIRREMMDMYPKAKDDKLSHLAWAAVLRKGLQAGEISRSAAQTVLIPYSSSDQVNRAWAYFWHKEFTSEILEKFERGAIKSLDDAIREGTPYFSDVIRKGFKERYTLMGREEALQYIGKMAADESNFIYGAGAQMHWMQSPFGRLAGMFGTWPVWALEGFVRRPMKYGSATENMKLAARIAAVSGAMANMSMQLGINMYNWIAPSSLFTWAGGPAMDYLSQVREVLAAPYSGKLNAARRVPESIGRLLFPGQVAIRDWQKSFQDGEDLGDVFMGITLGRPMSKSNMAMDYIFAPTTSSLPSSPEQLMLGGAGVNLDTMGIPSIQSLMEKFSVPDAAGVSGSQSSTSLPDLNTLMGNR